MSHWIEGKVTGKRQWTERLFSLQVAAPELTFVAGQFARLALPAPPGAKEPMLGRPYSFVNPPQRAPHEFYFNVLPEGPLSPRLAALKPGAPLWLLERANGFFSPRCRRRPCSGALLPAPASGRSCRFSARPIHGKNSSA